ncbi:DUF4265 domain-containing protein [Mucilaginibacter ginsenosidivorax]|uniref:DUF4265 domain-containing protein n=1 Tax=Mucilaginibacter ginsenosidivorax TaxID=862126 RepID=A0A5B8W1U5_9SPHI|nr:DUF4265 domain-containing protein [Mucilaginibacter ginsenosidivorax]QEC76288.1 DUF4265 domain-containing protein [Mucilaginibacter ginsenosidivorax]
MKDKVLLVYKDEENYQIESVWSTKVGNYYRIDNIPFFAKNIAPGDIVSIQDDDGQLFFDELIEASGNSVVRIIFFSENDITRVTKELEMLGCNWEGSHLNKLISIEIPKSIPYGIVKKYLEHGLKAGIFDYQEACLGFK